MTEDKTEGIELKTMIKGSVNDVASKPTMSVQEAGQYPGAKVNPKAYKHNRMFKST